MNSSASAPPFRSDLSYSLLAPPSAQSLTFAATSCVAQQRPIDDVRQIPCNELVHCVAQQRPICYHLMGNEMEMGPENECHTNDDFSHVHCFQRPKVHLGNV